MFEVNKEKGLTLIEIADGVAIQDIVDATCEFEVSPDLKPMQGFRRGAAVSG